MLKWQKQQMQQDQQKQKMDKKQPIIYSIKNTWNCLAQSANQAEDAMLYKIGWCLLAFGVVYGFTTRRLEVRWFQIVNRCLVHTLTGGYCPGCGGTRALIALLHGQVVQSIYYHPLVLYTAVVGGWFMLSQTIDRLSKNRTDLGMHYRHIYTVIGVGIMLVNCIVKNIMFFSFHIEM